MLKGMIESDLELARQMIGDGECVCLMIFQLCNRHYVSNPVLIDDDYGLWVTDCNGNYFNLENFSDVSVMIKCGNWEYVSLGDYTG